MTNSPAAFSCSSIAIRTPLRGSAKVGFFMSAILLQIHAVFCPQPAGDEVEFEIIDGTSDHDTEPASESQNSSYDRWNHMAGAAYNVVF